LPRILFVKTSSLGDVIHNCPAVSDVARQVPGAEIDWVVEEPFAEVASLHPAVRRVIPVAIRRWRSEVLSTGTWSEFGGFRRLLRAERYDAVIDTQGLLKSALVALNARGARHGFDAASAREPVAARLYEHHHAVSGALHAVERNRALAGAALGYAPAAPCDYGLRAPQGAPLQVRAPYAILLTMSSREDKLWPEEHWRSLGGALEARGVHCLLPWGSDEERRRCARIASAIRGAMVPRHLSLSELASLVRDARCVVGVDTGLTHLAAALQVPALAVFCGSEPSLTGLHGAGRVANLGAMGRPPSVAEALGTLEPWL
jgi:heptosyltransferase-1